MIKAKNLHYHDHSITTRDKASRNGHKPCVVWMTGLSGTGKSTIASCLESKLFDLKIQTHILDGDNVRMGLNKDLGFKPHERKENIRRIGEVANLFAQSGTVVITAFISPYYEDRKAAREASSENFLEVFVKTDLSVCESRDPKGLYKKARSGIIPEFTGISSPYEEPVQGEGTMVVDTTLMTAEESADAIIEKLIMMKVLGENN
jgi:adenylyl-sulfate kinase